jgi:hypothetical protein
MAFETISCLQSLKVFGTTDQVFAYRGVPGQCRVAPVNLLYYGDNFDPATQSEQFVLNAVFHLDQKLKMTLGEFRGSFSATAPPAGLTHALTGLW